MQDHTQLDTGYFQRDACDIGAFREIIRRRTKASDAPTATQVQKNVPVYEMRSLEPALKQPDGRKRLMSEWAHILLRGAGAVVLQNAFQQTEVIDRATDIYEKIIAAERLENGGGADHFAASGANDRIWNSLQKLCEKSPETCLSYFANVPIAAICEAWLGPGFQMTAQVNVVHPGGAAQEAHRDYHLGFQTTEQSLSYPAHVHALSPVLTLQGAIAHCDMPVESGPTKLLPHSQLYAAGYAAFRRSDFRACFEENCVQLPLRKGDALFFNPALFHAAGANETEDIHRMANLLQISSAFGRAMETVDRSALCKRVYPVAVAMQAVGSLTPSQISAAIACLAEGYPFPTNLDRDPPSGGLAPETQAGFFARALREGMDAPAISRHLAQMDTKRRA